MEMKYGLSRARPNIKHRSIPLLNVALPGDVRGRQMAAADEFGVAGLSLFQSSKMFLGDDEDMRRRLRADVFKSKDLIILVNFLRRNFAVDDAAEEATGIGHGWFTLGETIAHSRTQKLGFAFALKGRGL